jgi:HSP20 family protein
MPMDLFKAGDHYVLLADLPGVDPESVDIDVDGGTLTIRAERPGQNEESIEWLTSERFTGSYMRQLALGDGISPEAISAAYENGVLRVVIPLAERARPRKVEVTSSSPSGLTQGAQQEHAQIAS